MDLLSEIHLIRIPRIRAKPEEDSEPVKPVAAPTLRIDEETKNRASLTGAQLAEQNKAAAAAEAKAKKEAAAVQVSSFHALSAFLISSPLPIPHF